MTGAAKINQMSSQTQKSIHLYVKLNILNHWFGIYWTEYTAALAWGHWVGLSQKLEKFSCDVIPALLMNVLLLSFAPQSFWILTLIWGQHIQVQSLYLNLTFWSVLYMKGNTMFLLQRAIIDFPPLLCHLSAMSSPYTVLFCYSLSEMWTLSPAIAAGAVLKCSLSGWIQSDAEL